MIKRRLTAAIAISLIGFMAAPLLTMAATTFTTTSITTTGTLQADGDSTFDTDTLFVDAAGNRVGIGTATPTDGVLQLGNSADVSAMKFGPVASRHHLVSNRDLVLNAFDVDGVINGSALFYIRRNTTKFDEATFTDLVTVLDNGNLGIGDVSPASLLTVGSGDRFQVNSTGDLVKIDNVTYDWPAANATGVLTNNGSGTLSWAAASASPAGAAGQIQFNNAGAFGANAKLHWNNTDSNLIVSNSGTVTTALPWEAHKPKISAIGGSATFLFPSIAVESFSTNVGVRNDFWPVLMVGRSNNATEGTMTYPVNNQTLGSVEFAGAIETTGRFHATASITAATTEAWSNTANGTYLSFWTTANTSPTLTEQMRIQNNGNVNTFKHLVRSTTENITAFATGGQAGAFQITTDIAQVSTVATAGDSVKLPDVSSTTPSNLGMQITVINTDATDALDLFPASGDSINSLAANAAYSVGAQTTAICTAYSNNKWDCQS